MKQAIQRLLPAGLNEHLRPAWRGFRRRRMRAYQRAANLFGLNIALRRDYYSTLPVLEDLYRNEKRWNRPSPLVGVNYDLDAMKSLLDELVSGYGQDVISIENYERNRNGGFGPGYPRIDAITTYALLRRLRPARYLEVGSGLSTFYAHLAGQANAKEGRPMQMTCVEPYPFDALRALPGIELIVDEVQNVPAERFSVVGPGDVLFIDSTHALRVDSDVAYLFMEIVPRVTPGAWIHVHDIHFPYNTPFPADFWVMGDRWPVYWQEAMVLQAFLAFNSSFKIRLSTPLIRHFDESFIRARIPDYERLSARNDAYSSIWIERIA